MIQLFTFRNFPKELLDELDRPDDVYSFGKLHEGLSELDTQPADTHFIGFALSQCSRQEQIATNKFNQGIIDASGPNTRKLQIINTAPFTLSDRATHTFCNWTMYKLSEHYKVSFFHLKREDWPQFVEFTKEYLARE